MVLEQWDPAIPISFEMADSSVNVRFIRPKARVKKTAKIKQEAQKSAAFSI